MKREEFGDFQGRAYRFFFHYNKQTGKLTVHYRERCHSVRNVQCMAVTETKWNKSQPRLVMQGFAVNLIIEDGNALLL